jgi:hypothetical protein
MYTVACRPIAEQRPWGKQIYKKHNWVTALQINMFPWRQLNCNNEGTVFSVWSVPRWYKQDKLGAAVIGQSVKLLLAFPITIIPAFSLLKIHDQDFYFLLDMYVFRNWATSLTKEGLVSLCRCYNCCTILSAWVHPRCHGIQVIMDSAHPLLLHYIT